MSGARTRREHDSGRPPPRMSSREGIPVDVIVVRDDAGDGFVPASPAGCFPVPLRLKEDIIVRMFKIYAATALPSLHWPQHAQGTLIHISLSISQL